MTVDALSPLRVYPTLPGLFLSWLAMLLIEVVTGEFGGGTGEWTFFRALDEEQMQKLANTKWCFPAVNELLSWVELKCWGVSLFIQPITFLLLSCSPMSFLSPNTLANPLQISCPSHHRD